MQFLSIFSGVLILLICVQILVRLDSITMEVRKPAWWKTAKIHRNEHTTI